MGMANSRELVFNSFFSVFRLQDWNPVTHHKLKDIFHLNLTMESWSCSKGTFSYITLLMLSKKKNSSSNFIPTVPLKIVSFLILFSFSLLEVSFNSHFLSISNHNCTSEVQLFQKLTCSGTLKERRWKDLPFKRLKQLSNIKGKIQLSFLFQVVIIPST